ncbi:MAG: winged helix DNA-binding domain-containing protein [Actinomycetota bacterium]
MRLSAPAVRGARLRAQRLAGTRAATVADVAQGIVAVQAQDMGAAALAIRARTTGLVVGDVVAAVAGRSVAVAWSLRGTRHLHAAEDVAWIRALVEPVFNRPTARDRQLGIAGAAGDRGLAALRKGLEAEGFLTRGQAKELLAQAGIDVSGQAPIHLISRAAFEGLLVIVPTPGATQSQDRYALAETWLSPAPRVDLDRAVVWLAERYLAAYSPATPGDLASWSGLPRGLVSLAWAGVADRLVEVEVEGAGAVEVEDGGPGSPERLWSLRSSATLQPGAGWAEQDPAPELTLAGAFDPFLLGYADRSLHLAPEYARPVNPGGGILRPVVFVGGRVSGTWALRRRPFGVTVSAFGDVAIEPDPLARESADIERFLG